MAGIILSYMKHSTIRPPFSNSFLIPPQKQVWTVPFCHDPGDLQVFYLSSAWKLGSFETSRNSIFPAQIPLTVSWLSPNTQMWDRSASRSFGRAGCPTCAMDSLWRTQMCCQHCHCFSSCRMWGWPQELHEWDWSQRKKPQPRDQGTIFLVK